MSDKNKNVASTGNTVGKVTSAGGPGFGNKRSEGLSGKILLKVSDLKVSYGGIEAVRGISFDVPEGEIVTLIGANGAGKSSTLRSIVGLEKPASGSITFNGMELTAMGT